MFYVSAAFTRKGGDTSKNCLLSTIYTPKSILRKFPKTKILVAEVDPLRDNGIYLGLNLKRAGVMVKIYYFKEYIHNFIQFDSTTYGIPEY
jgi:acetyl esterase/lipase